MIPRKCVLPTFKEKSCLCCGQRKWCHTNMDPTHTYSRVSWPKYGGSSSLHLPALNVKTAWNRGGNSDRLLWSSLVNSYWTPHPSSTYPARPPTILPREQALMASFIPSLWRELMCGVPPFPYQPPIGIPLWSAVSPQPPPFALISISIWSVHWTLTPHRQEFYFTSWF